MVSSNLVFRWAIVHRDQYKYTVLAVRPEMTPTKRLVMATSMESAVAPQARRPGLNPPRPLGESGRGGRDVRHFFLVGYFMLIICFIHNLPNMMMKGFMMVTVSLFLKGHPLYDKVVHPVRPLLLSFRAGRALGPGVPLTNDGTRTVKPGRVVDGPPWRSGAFVVEGDGPGRRSAALAYVLTVFHLHGSPTSRATRRNLSASCRLAPVVACWVLDRGRPGLARPGTRGDRGMPDVDEIERRDLSPRSRSS